MSQYWIKYDLIFQIVYDLIKDQCMKSQCKRIYQTYFNHTLLLCITYNKQ